MPVCVFNQVNEYFSDWIAAEILPKYIKQNWPTLTQEQIRNGIANTRGHLCDQKTPIGKLVSHPQTNLRVLGIIGAQPELRNLMGCKTLPRHAYCDARSTDQGNGGEGRNPKISSPASELKIER